ncbi:hypothetical protein CDL15_Pgr028108 [Punica granatum]|uniref:Uncharacterized protein n=1 Tax=Punica granatum TaxID=22663 RepID=A0A218XLG5_PUNGR|nr:hypothetical protein CDL15_Pgr028108 [Punica granatum]
MRKAPDKSPPHGSDTNQRRGKCSYSDYVCFVDLDDTLNTFDPFTTDMARWHKWLSVHIVYSPKRSFHGAWAIFGSATDMIFKFYRRTPARSLGNRTMEPSNHQSTTTSQSTATGSRPTTTVRSAEASVCPARLRSQPSPYFNRKLWPGLLKSSGPSLSWADNPSSGPIFGILL